MFYPVNPALHPMGLGVDRVEQADKRVIKPIKHKSVRVQTIDEQNTLPTKEKVNIV